MRKILAVLFIISSCCIGIFLGIYYRNKALLQTQAQMLQPVIPTGVPITITIPSIHVQARIESVGLDNHNLMDVPQDTHDVAWYNLGPMPGQNGNAVIDGHVDDQTGRPAVFASLKNVHIGDKITIAESLGTKSISHEFVVTSTEDLPTQSFPVTRVFGSTSGAHLNLITCTGIWDTKSQNYSERLVVFSKLVK